MRRRKWRAGNIPVGVEERSELDNSMIGEQGRSCVLLMKVIPIQGLMKLRSEDGAQEVGSAHSTDEASNDRGGKGLT